METDTATIPVRSQPQAMDWSLVLISQGIESEIEFSGETGVWALRVAGPDYDRAIQAIHQYRRENRRWPWRREMHSGAVFDWASLAWVILITFFFWVSEARADLRSVGAMDSEAVVRGEAWRLFTAIWLHGDLAHLAMNATLGLLLLGLALGRYGTGVGFLSACLAGVGGNVLAFWLDPGTHRSLGASGLVMGCLGLLAVQSFVLRPVFRPRDLVIGVVGATMLFVLFGLSPGTDVLAHLGGFLSGLGIGFGWSLVPRLMRLPVTNAVSGAVFMGSVVWPWYLAFGSLPA